MAEGAVEVPTLRWTSAGIEILDQTRLPAAVVVRRLETVGEVVAAIRSLAIRGAPAIGACGAYGVALGVQRAPQPTPALLAELRQQLGGARPTAVNLRWAVDRVADACLAAGAVQDWAAVALREAHAVFEEDRQACTRIGEHGRLELPGAVSLLTHCNTGRLATCGWGTALGVVYAKAARGEAVRVVASETRPLLQGARLTTWELERAGIPVTLVSDTAAAFALSQGMADAVIVGADRIARNGDVANKVGTLAHAIAARQFGIPFYVAAPLTTFDPAAADGGDVVVEQRAPEEVRRFGAALVAPQGVAVWNPAFDITPAELITALITDAGVLHPPYPGAITAALRQSGALGPAA